MGFVQLTKKILLKAILLAGGPYIKKQYSGLGHILMFHSVLPSSGKLRIANDSLEVTPEHLEFMIRFFREKAYDIIALDELPERLKSGNPRKFVVFTFDDGYLDNLTFALPVFRKYQAPFTVYITTNFPDKKALIWWYPLEEILRENTEVAFTFNGKRYQFPAKNPAEKLESFIQIRDLIQRTPEAEVEPLVTTILNAYGKDGKSVSEKMAMNWEQVKTLAADPLVTIGAHTVNHYRLNTLTEEALKFEMAGSKKILETQLNRPVEHFSYPFGTRNDVGEREFKMAAACGFKTATTTRFGNIFEEYLEHLHALPRINIDGNVGEKELQGFLNGATQFATYRGKRVITF
jgi:peptidoglycan/xylan/chitin deacetylase (PgdA/CDA1 family)